MASAFPYSFQTWRKIVTVEGFIRLSPSALMTHLYSLSCCHCRCPSRFILPTLSTLPACSFLSLKWKNPRPDNQPKTRTKALSPVLDALSHKSYQSYMSCSLSLPLSFWSHCGILLYKISSHYREKGLFTPCFSNIKKEEKNEIILFWSIHLFLFLQALWLKEEEWPFSWPFRKFLDVSLGFKTLQWKYGSECQRKYLYFFSDADLLTVKYPVLRNFAYVLFSGIQLTGVICPATWSSNTLGLFL